MVTRPGTGDAAADETEASATVGEQPRSATLPKLDPRDDVALVRACVAGEAGAWDELVERYGRLVLASARRCGLGPEDAEDVFQNVFTIMLRRLETLRDQARLSSWLITTTYRESWRLARARRDATTAELDDQLRDTREAPPEEVARLEREQLVHAALRRIDDRCRNLLMALFLDAGEPSYEEISARFGMAIGSIGPTRARCFRKLEAVLAEVGIDGAH